MAKRKKNVVSVKDKGQNSTTTGKEKKKVAVECTGIHASRTGKC